MNQNKVTVYVTVMDKHSKLVKSYSLELYKGRIEFHHSEAKKVWSEYWVNFTWNNGKSFICGVPYEMSLDDDKLLNNEMSIDKYKSKWYPIKNNQTK